MADDPNATPKPDLASQILDAINARGGGEEGAMNLVRSVYAEKAQADAKLAAAERRVSELEASAPAESDVVLKGEAADRYRALVAREGFADDPLKVAADRLDASADALAEVQRMKDEARQDAAYRAAGLDPAKVRKYAPGTDARMEGEGEAAKPVAVLTADDGTETVKPLAEAFDAEILPVLRGNADTQAARGGRALPGRSTATAPPAAGGGILAAALDRQRAVARPDLHRTEA